MMAPIFGVGGFIVGYHMVIVIGRGTSGTARITGGGVVPLMAVFALIDGVGLGSNELEGFVRGRALDPSNSNHEAVWLSSKQSSETIT
jgi:hypothetical protein